MFAQVIICWHALDHETWKVEEKTIIIYVNLDIRRWKHIHRVMDIKEKKASRLRLAQNSTHETLNNRTCMSMMHMCSIQTRSLWCVSRIRRMWGWHQYDCDKCRHQIAYGFFRGIYECSLRNYKKNYSLTWIIYSQCFAKESACWIEFSFSSEANSSSISIIERIQKCVVCVWVQSPLHYHIHNCRTIYSSARARV